MGMTIIYWVMIASLFLNAILFICYRSRKKDDLSIYISFDQALKFIRDADMEAEWKKWIDRIGEGE